jgi:hypothetical protein
MSRDRSYRGNAPAHPLERVIQEVAADYCEADLGAREDGWAQDVRRDVEARLARLRRRIAAAPGSQRQGAGIPAELPRSDSAALLARVDALPSPGSARKGRS